MRRRSIIKAGLINADAALTKRIGVLPRQLYQPFVTLGHCFEPVVWIVILSAAAVAMAVAGEFDNVQLLLVAIMALPVSSLIKMFVRRRRPKTMRAGALKIKSYSFPSSHAYSSFIGASVLAIIVAGVASSVVPLVIAGLITFVIGVSRVYIGVHYPSDVLGGWALAMLVLTIILRLT